MSTEIDVNQSPIPSLDPHLLDADIQAILVDLARTGGWSSYAGPYLQTLSKALEHRCQRAYVQLCCSGTFAMELALRGCRIQGGDEVLLAAYDFPGNFRAIEAVGASATIVDIPESGWSLTATAELEQALGPSTKAVIVSHLHGTTAAVDAICDWARQRELRVIEDACQAPGATIADRPAGSWGDCSILSFGGSKLLSAGRGGAVLTDDPRIDQRMRIYRERGNDAFAISELQAAVLGPQLRQLDVRHALRAAVVQDLEREVARWKWIACPKRCQPIHQAAFYKWGFQVIPSKTTAVNFRDTVVARLQNQGVLAGPGFRGFGGRSNARCRRLGSLPNSTRAAEGTVLVHHTMLGEQLIHQLSAVDRQLRDADLIDQ